MKFNKISVNFFSQKSFLLFLILFSLNIFAADKNINRNSFMKLRIGITQSLKSAPFVIARKYFKDEGLDVELFTYQSGVEGYKAYNSGKVDFFVGPELFVMTYNQKLKDSYILCSLNKCKTQFLVMKKNDDDLSLRPLIDKKIAIKGNSSSEYYLYRMLIKNAMSLEDVNVVDVYPKDMAKALKDGSISAALVWDPFAEQCLKAFSDNGIKLDAQKNRPMFWCLYGKKDIVENNKSLIVKLLRCINNAEKDLSNKNKTSLFKELIDFFNVYDMHNIKMEFNEYEFSLSLSQELLIILQAESFFYRQTRNKEISDDILSMFYFDAIEKVIPGSVSIIH